MWKHYQLSKLVNQGNNFVIYEEFFDDARKSSIVLIYILRTCRFLKAFNVTQLLKYISKYSLNHKYYF